MLGVAPNATWLEEPLRRTCARFHRAAGARAAARRASIGAPRDRRRRRRKRRSSASSRCERRAPRQGLGGLRPAARRSASCGIAVKDSKEGTTWSVAAVGSIAPVELDSTTSIYGIHAVDEALAAGEPLRAIHVAATAEATRALRELLARAKERGVPVRFEQRAFFAQLPFKAHQGVVAIAPPFEYASLHDILARRRDGRPRLIRRARPSHRPA